MLTGIAIALLLLLFLLAIPFTVSFNLTWERKLSGHLQLGWGFGLVNAHLPVGDHVDNHTASLLQQESKQKGRRSSTLDARKLLRNKPFRQRMLHYLHDMWHAIEKRDLALFMRVGLGDPADTGLLWSVLGPLAAILSTHRESTISLQPDFLDPGFALESSGTVRLVPLQPLYLTVRLLLSPTVWSALINARAEVSPGRF